VASHAGEALAPAAEVIGSADAEEVEQAPILQTVAKDARRSAEVIARVIER